MKRYLPLLLLFAAPAFAQTVSLTPSLGTGAGVIPVLTWSSTPAAASCTASGDWTGAKAASGTQTLPAITTGKTYTITCSWPGDTTATLEWGAVTQNDNNSPITNCPVSLVTCLASYKVFRSTTAAGIEAGTMKVVNVPLLTTQYIGLAPGTHYFGVKATDSRGFDGGMSTIASKTIVAAATASDTASITFPGVTILTVR